MCHPFSFFFQAEDGIRDWSVTGVQTCALPILHIEQGPVLESMNRSAGVVLGTFGLERNMVRFVGQAAHSGSTTIAMRRDAFLAAAATALRSEERRVGKECRARGRRE